MNNHSYIMLIVCFESMYNCFLKGEMRKNCYKFSNFYNKVYELILFMS